MSTAAPLQTLAATPQPLSNSTHAGLLPKSRKRLQAKLTVGASNDPLEHEADRIADQVLTAPEPAEARGAPLQIQRSAPAGAVERDTAPASVDRALASPGTPLEPALRQDMEQRFGHDFSRVRVHADAAGGQSAQEVSANAYTVGHQIVFGPGRFAPGTPAGRRLLAHELTHVVQQSRSHPVGAGPRLVQRDKNDTPTGTGTVQGTAYILNVTGVAEDVEKELLRLGILTPADYDGWGFLGEGYYFSQSTGSGDTFRHFRVLDALYIRNAKNEVTGYRVISYLQPRGPAAGPQATPSKKATVAPDATDKQQVKKPAKPANSTNPKAEVSKPVTAPPTGTTEQMQAQFDALPQSIKQLMLGGKPLKPEDLPQLLRIAKRLAELQPEDLALYKLLAKKLAADLDSFERSVEFFIQFKAKIKEQADAEQKPQASNKELTLEEKLSKTWGKFDEKKFGGMTAGDKEALARDIAAEQRNIQLEHMATHPGQTAVDMAEGMVRLDKTAKAIAEDVKDAADGSKGAYTRLAGAVGAYNKYVAAAASIVFVALLFVPGVNLIELAAAGLAVAVGTIVLSVAESELRIKAAGEAKTPEDFKSETAKSAAAQTQAVVAAAMLALTLAMKIIARIPLPGRYQNVGAALKAGQAALLEKSGVGPAWKSIKTDLLSKLRSAKQGLPEALADQSKAVAGTAKVVEGMSGDEFVKQLAAGDPKLADLGITPDQAKAIQQLSGTAEGKKIPEQLRQDSLQALQDAPVEAGKKVNQFLTNVDDAIGKVEKASSQEQLKAAVDDANAHLGAEEQAKQAATDEQAFVKKRLESARRSGVREQAQKKLDELQPKKATTQAEIARLERERSEANLKVNQLKKKALESPPGSPERANALKEFQAAKEALEELLEADELGGYKEERARQNKLEEDILASLELKRPSLWQSTKDAIKKAAKTNKEGQFLDANTGEVIQGEPVYGHKYGRENRRLLLEASEKGMTQEQFNQWLNEHPEWFQTETKANNENHRFEKPGID